jgi:hypothetical protein
MHHRIRLTGVGFLGEAGESCSSNEPGVFAFIGDSFKGQGEDLRI